VANVQVPALNAEQGEVLDDSGTTGASALAVPLAAAGWVGCCVARARLKINKCTTISGIQLHLSNEMHEIRCTQYADDTCIYLRDLDQVKPCLKALQSFTVVSGLNLNLHKTEGMCIGSISEY
jgi:hypothetical protein